jgi:helix-turn-helix protein
MTSPIERDTRALTSEKDAARFLSVSQRTLQAWRALGSGPPYIKMGRAIRYCMADLIAWTESKRR